MSPEELIDEEAPDPREILQKLCSHTRRPSPRYIETSSEDSSFAFACEVRAGMHTLGSGVGVSRKEAQKAAAESALMSFDAQQVEAAHQGRRPKALKRVPKKKRKEAAHKRKSQRGSDKGRAFESTVSGYLAELKETGAIDQFTYHEPQSSSDLQGKDFTVKKASKSVSFGVTTSLESMQHSRALHPNIKIFYFPHNTKPETVKKRVVELLNAAP